MIGLKVKENEYDITKKSASEITFANAKLRLSPNKTNKTQIPIA